MDNESVKDDAQAPAAPSVAPAPATAAAPKAPRASKPRVPGAPAKPKSAAKPRKKLSKTAIALIAVSGVAVLGWASFAVAVNVAANTNDELVHVQADNTKMSGEKDDLIGDLTEMTASRDQYMNASDAVAKREEAVKVKETALQTREDAVKGREDAVTGAEARVAQTTLKDGYSYIVGVSMEPGVYEATSASGTCYWEINTSGTNGSDIVDNDLGAQGLIRVTVSGGQDFNSSRCGDWKKVG
ncbi:hypothetical protein [Leifsonia sp. Leaf264]|uniref:hypothetical protein n=1 Tax=Leifsonia sp. Leaf264 TaxID=1736314 RepID=UPI0006F9430A|nr:hypothetical protein [Leifsonia sp. Leaf264]KQO98923.1 hypothetical protein ASF30_12755 [Leifsonia sp. Leaf264]